MTLKEFCLRVGRSESTVKSSWKRTKETLEKKGIIVNKVKVNNEEWDYTIEYKEK